MLLFIENLPANKETTMTYDFQSFLDSVKYFDRADIMTTAEEEHHKLDKSSTKMTRKESVAIQQRIASFIRWMNDKEIPANFTPYELTLLKEIEKKIGDKKLVKTK